MNQQKLSRIKLLGLIAAFAGPLCFALVLFLGKEWFEFDSAAHGRLLTPGQILTNASALLVARENKTVAEHWLDGRWVLLFYGRGDCDLSCEADLFKIRQSRLVLGRDSSRVRAIYLLAPQAVISPELNQILIRHPALSIYRLQPRTPINQATPDLKEQGIYIIDPLGNLVMSYAQNIRSRALIKDLKRLLKASKIG